MEIPETHPLQQLFRELVGRHYAEEIGIRDPQVVSYVAHLLSEFCDAEQLLKIRNAAGKPLNDVGEMLIESDPIYGPAPSFDRERQVRKHIGDYTLFYAGMFPESINHYRLRRQRVEGFVDWWKAGRRVITSSPSSSTSNTPKWRRCLRSSRRGLSSACMD